MRFTPLSITSTYAAVAPLNSNFDDIQALFERCVFKDGAASNALTSDLDLNHFRLSNIGAPENAQDAVRLSDLAAYLPVSSGLSAALAATSGSGLVGYVPRGTSAVAETLKDQLDKGDFYAENFRSSGDTDRQVLTKAFAAWATRGTGKLVLGENRTYSLGTTADSTIFTVLGLRDAILEGNGATLSVASNNAQVIILYLYNYKHLTIRNLNGADTGITNGGSAQMGSIGAKLVVVDSDASNPSENISLINVRGFNLNTFFNANPGNPNRIKGILIDESCVADTCFYGAVFQGNGDNATVRGYFKNCGRSYFPYGVAGHDTRIRIDKDGTGPAAEADVVVKRYTRDVKNIKMDLSYSGTLANTNLVLLEHENNSGSASIIDDIDITFHIEDGITDSGPATRVLYRSRNASAVEDTGTVTQRTKNVRISGQLGNSSLPHIKVNYTPAVPDIIKFGNISGLSLTKTVDANGMLVQVAPDRFVIEKFGALTGSTIAIPVLDLRLLQATFRFNTYLETISTNAGQALSKTQTFTDEVPIYINAAGAGNVGVVGTERVHTKAWNSANGTLAYSGGTDQLILTFGGSDYNVSTAYARVEVQLVSGRPFKR